MAIAVRAVRSFRPRRPLSATRTTFCHLAGSCQAASEWSEGGEQFH
jgi:hypothetical protein